MLKKVIIGILLVTVVGAGAAALTYQLINRNNGVSAASAPEPLAVDIGQDASSSGDVNITENPQLSQSLDVSVSAAEEEPWQAVGTITAVDDFGFDLQQDDGETVYVELGPPDYWQVQGVSVEVGQQVEVIGSTMGGMYHAYSLQIVNGDTLQVRTENGQPLWSGGAANGQGQNGQADGDHVPDPQAQVDEWVTVEGELLSYQNGTMTMTTTDGQVLTFRTGQPRFFAEQGITFQVGEQISVLGFYEGDQFSAGEITQVSTGLRVMLRDPNGRPLWAGPGNSNGQGNNGAGSGGAGNQSAGGGTPQGGNGQGGNGYHGGR